LAKEAIGNEQLAPSQTKPAQAGLAKPRSGGQERSLKTEQLQLQQQWRKNKAYR
jgi:hypothetical protein